MNLTTTAPPTGAAIGVAIAPYQRRQRRWSHRVPCLLRVVDDAGAELSPLRGETVNMSPGGVAVQVGERVALGTAVEAVIARSNEDEMLVIRGRVVHSRRMLTGMYEIGVSIVGHESRT